MAGWSGWRLGAGALLQEAVQCLLMSKRSQNEAGASGKGSVWVGEGITVPYGWLLGGTESHSLHGIAVSALSPCSRAPKTNSGDLAFTCVAAVLSLQLVAFLLNKNPNSRPLFSMS